MIAICRDDRSIGEDDVEAGAPLHHAGRERHPCWMAVLIEDQVSLTQLAHRLPTVGGRNGRIDRERLAKGASGEDQPGSPRPRRRELLRTRPEGPEELNPLAFLLGQTRQDLPALSLR
jgi:hypothetical protein